MPTYNYVREHRRFIRYASDNKLTASEFRLWHALFDVFNDESEGNIWPDGFIRISNGRLLMLCDPMGIDTMVRARNGLKQRGLIEFIPGNKNKENPAYLLKLFYPDGYTQNADKNGFYTQNAYNIGGNMGGNIQGNTWGNMGGNMPPNMGDIYINQNKDYTETKRDMDEDDDDGDEAPAGAREERNGVIPCRNETAETIGGAFLRAFGRAAYPEEINRLAWAGTARGFSAEMIAEAVRYAAEEGARKPVRYAESILDDWKAAHVMQPHQIGEYRLEEDIRRGKAPVAGGTGDAAEDFRIREENRTRRLAENAEAGLESFQEAQ